MRGKLAREALRDVMLGIVLGAFNGYLIAGTIWYFLDKAGYPFPTFLVAPEPTDTTTKMLIGWLAPNWLTPEVSYFAVGIAFVFVIILFV